MRRIGLTTWIAAALSVLCLPAFVAPAGAANGNLILQVPDWNQPDSYAPTTAGLAVGDYPDWCAPTSGANLMGYWEDVVGCTGLTDRQTFNSSPTYPNTAGTQQQGLWHDATVEMGWYMDTGGWQSVPRGFPPLAGSTSTSNILPGMLTYATTGWTDGGTGITKTAYTNATGYTDNVSGVLLSQMWSNYCAEIDAGRPTVSTFAHWVTTPFFATDTVDGFSQTIEKYNWNTSIEEHSVTGVGYLDYTQGFNGDEWFIVHDNWGSTGTFAAVPVDSNWIQNDYVTAVPEPVTLSLLAVGAVALIRRRRAA